MKSGIWDLSRKTFCFATKVHKYLKEIQIHCLKVPVFQLQYYYYFQWKNVIFLLQCYHIHYNWDNCMKCIWICHMHLLYCVHDIISDEHQNRLPAPFCQLFKKCLYFYITLKKTFCSTSGQACYIIPAQQCFTNHGSNSPSSGEEAMDTEGIFVFWVFLYYIFCPSIWMIPRCFMTKCINQYAKP